MLPCETRFAERPRSTAATATVTATVSALARVALRGRVRGPETRSHPWTGTCGPAARSAHTRSLHCRSCKVPGCCQQPCAPHSAPDS